jgi:hypothetical protein
MNSLIAGRSSKLRKITTKGFGDSGIEELKNKNQTAYLQSLNS